MKNDDQQPCTDCQEIVIWNETIGTWTHPIPSECFMSSIMPTFNQDKAE
jgi:hypothetical protein